MYAVPPPAYPVQESVPPKIQAAFQFLHFCEGARTAQGCGIMGGDTPREGGRELSTQEKRAYDAALQTIIEYFNDPSPLTAGAPPPPPPPDDPEKRSPVLT